MSPGRGSIKRHFSTVVTGTHDNVRMNRFQPHMTLGIGKRGQMGVGEEPAVLDNRNSHVGILNGEYADWRPLARGLDP